MKRIWPWRNRCKVIPVISDEEVADQPINLPQELRRIDMADPESTGSSHDHDYKPMKGHPEGKEHHELDPFTSSDQDPSPPVTSKGLWAPSRFGEIITCRLWRVLDGNFGFCFDGRLMFGPGSWWCWSLIVLQMLATLTSFLIFETRVLDHWVLSLCSTILCFAGISNLLRTVFTEPGVLLRPGPDERLDNLIHYHTDKETTSRDFSRVMTLNGKETKCSFCDVCCMFRPPRAHHCDVCDTCIERLDHHCEYLGICIGRRNYGAFFRFLLFTSVDLEIVTIFSLKNFVTIWMTKGFILAAWESPTIFVIAFGAFLPPCGVPTLIGSCLRQLYMLAKDQTMFEKRHKDNNGYIPPFKGKGFLGWVRYTGRNVYQLVLCSPPRSHVQPRSYVKIKAVPKSTKRLQSEARRMKTFFSCPKSQTCGGDLASSLPNPNESLRGISILGRRRTKRRGSTTLPHPNVLLPRRSMIGTDRSNPLRRLRRSLARDFSNDSYMRRLGQRHEHPLLLNRCVAHQGPRVSGGNRAVAHGHGPSRSFPMV